MADQAAQHHETTDSEMPPVDGARPTYTPMVGGTSEPLPVPVQPMGAVPPSPTAQISPNTTWTAAQLPEIANPQAIKNVVPTLTHHKPGERLRSMTADAALVGTAYFAAASTRGALHHDFKSARQDNYHVTCTADERWLVFAVADGVGSVKHSHLAAELACRAATESVRGQMDDVDDPDRIDWASTVDACRALIRKQSAQVIDPAAAARASQDEIDRAIAREVMSTTLQVGIVFTASDSGHRRYLTARLAGDGSVYILSPNKRWTVVDLGKTADDGVQSNAVTPLPRDPGAPILKSGTLEPGQALLVCTDGIELYGGDNELGTFLAAAWASRVTAVEFLRTVSYVKTGSYDDRTAVVVWS